MAVVTDMITGTGASQMFLTLPIFILFLHWTEILDEGSSDSGDDAEGSDEEEEDEDEEAGDGIDWLLLFCQIWYWGLGASNQLVHTHLEVKETITYGWVMW